MPEISIIIRTKNEERWIGHCLAMIYKQTLQDFEVVLVDNKSDDHTVEIAKRYPVDHFVNIDEFLPGRALNEGIRASHGKYIVCLSAHCVPKDEFWLENLRKNFKEKGNLAGVYGRQLPVSFTDPVDKRDLLIVFGQDYRIQKKDYFFHNANSMLPRILWEKFPFDEQVTNIEDRVWGKQVIEAGYTLAYDPEAAVFHHHGLHQGNKSRRVDGVVSILERVDSEVMDELPYSLRPENIETCAFIPTMASKSDSLRMNQLVKVVQSLKASKYIRKTYIFSSFDLELDSTVWVDRRELQNNDSIDLESLICEAASKINQTGYYPDSIIYVNPDYCNRPDGIFDKLVVDSQYRGLDTVFPGFQDYGHYWVRDSGGDFSQIDPSMASRSQRDPMYRALYGLGCLMRPHNLRAGKMIGGKIGIIPLSDIRYAFTFKDTHDLSQTNINFYSEYT